MNTLDGFGPAIHSRMDILMTSNPGATYHCPNLPFHGITLMPLGNGWI